MKRSTFVAGSIVTTLGAAPARSTASDAPTVTTQLNWVTDVQAAGFWVADAKGYFRDAGVTSTVLGGGPSISVPTVIAAGRADVGVDQFERIVDASNTGLDLVVIGAFYQRDPSGLLSLPANPVRTARDITGKRIGLHYGSRQYIDAIMRLNHLAPDFSEVVVGFDPEPLVQHACDAFLCFTTNEPLALRRRGIAYTLVSFDALGYHTYTSVLFCRRDYLAAHRPLLVAYLRALQRGWETNARDPGYAAQLTVETYGAPLGLDATEQTTVNRAQIPLMQSAATTVHGMLWVDVNRVRGPVYTTLRAAGRTKLPNPNRLVDMSLLRDASR